VTDPTSIFAQGSMNYLKELAQVLRGEGVSTQIVAPPNAKLNG